MPRRGFALLLALAGTPACGDGGSGEADTGSLTSVGDAATITASSGSAGTDATSQEGGPGDDAGDGDGDATTQTTVTSTAGDGDGDSTSQTAGDGDGDGTMGPNWSMTRIEFSGGGVSEVVDLDDCQFCDVNDLGTHTLLRYQQGGGWTIWALYLPTGSTLGTQPLTQDYSGAYATLSANDASLPGAAQGMYFGDTNVGTVTLTAFDTGPGGVIAGNIDVTMTQGTVTAHLTATFQGTMP